MIINQKIILWTLRNFCQHITFFNHKWVIILTVISMLSVSKDMNHDYIHSSFFLIAHWHIECQIMQHLLNILNFISHVYCLIRIFITYFMYELKIFSDSFRIYKIWQISSTVFTVLNSFSSDVVVDVACTWLLLMNQDMCLQHSKWQNLRLCLKCLVNLVKRIVMSVFEKE